MIFFRKLPNFVKSSLQTSSFRLLSTTVRQIHKKYIISKQYLTPHVGRKAHIGNEVDKSHALAAEIQRLEDNNFAKNVLFRNSTDTIIIELNNCASVDDVLSVFKRHERNYQQEHLVQTIFVLRDLQTIFVQYNYFDRNAKNTFFTNLNKNAEFTNILKSLTDHLNNFDANLSSFLLVYLNKLGFQADQQLMQNLSLKLRDHLVEDFDLCICSRLFGTIFKENSVRPFYISKDLIPKVIGCIDTCDSVDDFGNLTDCLNKIYNVITAEILSRYKSRVQYFLRNKLKGSDFRTILKIITFLNDPNWRNESTPLMSECILLMKNEIGLMNIYELVELYGVFFKIQEPGEILNTLQRCSAIFLQKFEETGKPSADTALKIFSALIYFSSPLNRSQFQKDLNKFLTQCNQFGSIILLRKIFSYIKVSDRNLCENYWNITLKMLNDHPNVYNILQYSESYMNFDIDLDNFRVYRLEKRLMELMENNLNSAAILFPSVLAGFLSFLIIYSRNESTLQLLVNKFEQNLFQFKAKDLLKISKSLTLQRNFFAAKHVGKMMKLLNEATEHMAEIDSSDFEQNSMLIKGAIDRKDFDNITIDNLLIKYKEMSFMSSKMMETIVYIFLVTGTVIPEVINKCTEYVIKYPNNIVAYNAEKLLFLCYQVAYYPINAKKFFEVVTDIIIRDQERLSGLSFLQSALSLCFFNRLPSTFIKQIFNVEFLDRLDMELANSYSKDKYSIKVRKSLMELNRAVCLEYPEFNVPWFHKKYIEEFESRRVPDAGNHFPLRVKDYLLKLTDESNLAQNVVAPYGYHIDFLICLSSEGKIVPLKSEAVKKRIAVLLMRHHAYTRFYSHLGGWYQLRIRHLEMLGYDVSIVVFNEWINLLYADERIEYLTNVIWHPKKNTRQYYFKE